ncbi:alpha-glucuronidase [Actinospica robiniae]|uniref:alpha-glucuronidase n=1 Tax=Actinospica robiniae TaxID=304901 RepID=UPI000405F9FF|nr:alpha-glucuronidase [Actinospica robiniae]
MPALPSPVHPAWLPSEALRALGSRRVVVRGEGLLVETVAAETQNACARFGGVATFLPSAAENAEGTESAADIPAADLVFSLAPQREELGDEGFEIARTSGDVTTVHAAAPAGLLYGFFHVVRLGEAAFAADLPSGGVQKPALSRRMADHWDNVDVEPTMGQVERGYAGGSIFWEAGRLREDLSRVRSYARLLAACGINAVSVNNVNVHRTEAHLLTDRLGDVEKLAEVFRPYGIRVHLSVNFASPLVLGGLSTADPLDPAVRTWWAATTAEVYARIPDFGGYVVKADSEGQPGPFGYGRTHADGANTLADALAPFGGVVHWRAFVYNHRQDWRDRSTDRARAAHDHFAPLDGNFRENAILQVKHGPIDFQTREPISPVIAAMPTTRLAVELQATQEYTGQQKHVCYLAPMWSEVLGFAPWGENGDTVADVARGLVVVSNVGDDQFWTGHPLAQANLYAFGRLAWDPTADPAAILDEWIGLTFPTGAVDEDGQLPQLRESLHAMMDESWLTYEKYTAPLGVGFMVRPGQHYGPDVDGYEYTPWGTYHFADREGIGVDRTSATGTGYAAQYPKPWSETYEAVEQCPDELLLFFHHVPYRHQLHSGKSVIQHIYDTHFEGADLAAAIRDQWRRIADLPVVPEDVRHRMAERLDEQVRCAEEWRDQINTYFYRKSGIPDAHGRTIY